MKLIIPTRLVHIDLNHDVLFFFLGPIKGGDDWQSDGIQELQRYNFQGKNLAIAVPCRYKAGHPLYRFAVESNETKTFENQTPWERIYLALASKSNPGGIIAWFPRESDTDPRHDGSPYGRDSYGEVGEWRGRMMADPSIRFTLGAEPGFPGRDVMKRNFDEALHMNFPIYSSLEETIDAAVRKA